MKLKLVSLLFLFLLLLLPIVHAQNDDEEGGLGAGFLDFFKGFQTPTSLVDFLKNFGITEEISINWGGLIFFIIVPMLTFMIVLKAILVDSVIVGAMRLNTFRGWKGWIFVLLIIIFLFPTQILGMFAMWLYAAAGILVIYGFGALLIIAVIKRLIPGVKGRALGGIIAAVIIGIFLAFFNPAFGFIIAILGIAMGIGGFVKKKGVGFLSPYRESEQMGVDAANRLTTLWNQYERDIPPGAAKTEVIAELNSIIERSRGGQYTRNELERIIGEFENRLKSLRRRRT